MKTQSIAIIGGSGFIGARLARRLMAQGHRVRLLDVAESDRYPGHWRYCDVRDPESVARGCDGVEAIYHLAAEHRDDVTPRRLYDEVNVDGTRSVCLAAAELGVRRIVFTSSVAVYGPSDRPIDELTPPRPANDYGRTKWEAENVLRSWLAETPGGSLAIVRPSVVFGESNRGNVYNLLRQIARRRFVMIGSGESRKSMAYVENVAAFLQFALSFGPGEHLYNYADGPDFDMNRLVATARRQLGMASAPPTRLPYAVGLAAGYGCDLAARLSGRKLPISSIRVRKFCSSSRFSADKAMTSGFQPAVSLEEGLRRTIRHEFLQPATRVA